MQKPARAGRETSWGMLELDLDIFVHVMRLQQVLKAVGDNFKEGEVILLLTHAAQVGSDVENCGAPLNSSTGCEVHGSARPDLEAFAGHGVLHVLRDEDAEHDAGDVILVEGDAVDKDHGFFLVHDETLRKLFSLELGEEFGEVLDPILLEEVLNCFI